MNEETCHIPVMPQEVLEGLRASEGGSFLDCTYCTGLLCPLQNECVVQDFADLLPSLFSIKDGNLRTVRGVKSGSRRGVTKEQMVWGMWWYLYPKLGSLPHFSVKSV